MAANHSKSAIVKAIVGNGIITVVKSIAWVFSGSGSMLSEAIHSLVDTLNQGLLLIGDTRALMKPTKKHPYGFGMEANYWGLLAAMGILAFGGGLSIEHGIASLQNPHPSENLELALGVLVFAILVEGWILVSVMKDVASTRGDKTWWAHLKKQPSGTMTVLLEDLAAVLGCIVAAVAIGACVVTGNPVYDAVGQIVIGGILVSVGLVLIWRGRSMLIGESICSDEIRDVRIFLEDQEGIDRVTNLKTRQLSPYSYTLKAEVVFSGGFLASRLMDEYSDLFDTSDAPDKTRELMGRYSDDLFAEQAKRVDEIEAELKDTFPGAVYIDLEPHLKEG
jgi:solute carrier family 30 (zinc transporter), member 9